MLGGLVYCAAAGLGAIAGMRLGWLFAYQMLAYLVRKKVSNASGRLSETTESGASVPTGGLVEAY